MDNGSKSWKRRGRQQYRVVTSADVITIGKPVKSNPDGARPPRDTQVAAPPDRCLRKLTAAERQSLLKPPAIKEAVSKVASCFKFDELRHTLSQLVSQTAIANAHCAISRDDCESIVFLLLELGILIRRCPPESLASLVETVSCILQLTLARSCADSRSFILAAVAAIQAAIYRTDEHFPYPTGLVKCYVQDKMLASPQWTNLVESRVLCKWILDNCLYGRRRFFIDDKSCRLERHADSAEAGIVSHDVEISLYVCDQIFFSNATEKPRQWIAALKPKSQEGFTPEQFRLIGDCAVFYAVRKHLALFKIEGWLHDPKINKIAAELLAAIIVNARPGEDDLPTDDGQSLIGHILQMQLKPSVLQQIVLPAVHMQCQSATENIRMYIAECVFYLVRSNNGDPGRSRNAAMSVLHAVFDSNVDSSSTFLGEAFLRSLAEGPGEMELQMCCSILKELSILFSHRGDQLSSRAIQAGLLLNWEENFSAGRPTLSDGSSDLLVPVMDLNSVLLVLDVLQILRSDTTALLDETELLSILRPTVLQWQLKSLTFLRERQWPDMAVKGSVCAEYQRCVSSCFFFNPDLEPFSTIVAGMATENDRLAAVRVIVSSGTTEEILTKLAEMGCDPKLPISQLTVLEVIEQIVRRAAYSSDYGGSLSIESISNILRQVRDCWLIDVSDQKVGHRLLDPACFWRGCFILVFIVCLTDSEHDKEVTHVLSCVPTVRSMLEMLLTGQYVDVPDTVLLRLGRGSMETFRKLSCDFVAEEKRQTHVDTAPESADDIALYSEHYCDNWPRALNNIQLGKLKALNHSHKLSDRLLTNHPSVVEGILSELILNRAQEPTLFNGIFKSLAPIMSERLDVGQLIPVDCLCQYLLTEATDDSTATGLNCRVFSTIKAVVTDKLREPSQCRFDVLNFFVSELTSDSLKPFARDRVWRKLEELLASGAKPVSRLWEPGMISSKIPGDDPKVRELAENVVRALSLEFDQGRGLLLLDLALELLGLLPTCGGIALTSLVMAIANRPKFWKCLLNSDCGIAARLLGALPTTVAGADFEQVMTLLGDGEPRRGSSDQASATRDMKTFVKEAICRKMDAANRLWPGGKDLPSSCPRTNVPLLCLPTQGLKSSQSSGQPIISPVGDVDIRTCFYGDVDLRPRPEVEEANQTKQISGLITGSLRHQICIEELANSLLQRDRGRVLEALVGLADGKDTGEWLLSMLDVKDNRIIGRLLSQVTNDFKSTPLLRFLNREEYAQPPPLTDASSSPNDNDFPSDEPDLPDSNVKRERLAKAERTFIILSKAVGEMPGWPSSNLEKETNCKNIADYLDLQVSRDKNVLTPLLPLVEASQKDPLYKSTPKALAILQLLREAGKTNRVKTSEKVESARDSARPSNSACLSWPSIDHRGGAEAKCLASFEQDRPRWTGRFRSPHHHEPIGNAGQQNQDPRQRGPRVPPRCGLGETKAANPGPANIDAIGKRKVVNCEDCYTLSRRLGAWAFDEEDVSRPAKMELAQKALDNLLPKLVQLEATKATNSELVAKAVDAALNSSTDTSAAGQLADALNPVLDFYPGPS